MKKLLVVTLIACMLLSLAACGSSPAPAESKPVESKPAAAEPSAAGSAAAPSQETATASSSQSPSAIPKEMELIHGEPSAPVGSIKVIMGHANAENSIPQAYCTNFKTYVETADPAFSCEIYPLAQLGGDRELMESCQEGVIQACAESTSATSAFVPDSKIFDLPFAVRSSEEIHAVMEDPNFWGAISDSFAAANIKLGWISRGSFRALTSTVPVQHIEDFKNLDVRVMENDVHMGTFKALGCNTAVIPFNELYTSLQQNLVEAQDNAFNITVSMKFYEVCPYLTATNHQPSCGTYLMNLDWFNSLTESQQQVVMDGWRYAAFMATDPKISDQEALDEMMADGKHTYYEFTAEDIDKGAEMCADVWEIVHRDVSENIYNAYLGAIENYRNTNG